MKKFKLKLDRDWFNTGDVLNKNLLVVSKPKTVFPNIWYKLVYHLTFKTVFKNKIVCYEYNVKFKK